MNVFLYLLAIVAGVTVGWLLSAALREWRAYQREKGKVPWARVRAVNLWGDSSGFSKHNVLPVSRHHIAESGLNCPVCGNCAAERGDFSRVQRMRINGVENEVVECAGLREVENNMTVACGTYLAASPDTEHGDHLDANGNIDTDGNNDTPDFFRFKRITRQQATIEQYDADIFLTKPDTEDEALMISNTSEPLIIGTEPRTSRKHDVLMGEELQAAIRAECARAAAEDIHDSLSDTTPTIAIDPKQADTRKLPIVTPPPP